MKSGEEIVFSYSALFQSINIRIKHIPGEDNDVVVCEAEIKLPILKKTFITKTHFIKDTLDWVFHHPVSEKIEENKQLAKSSENEHAIDPIGFFMHLHKQTWNKDHVDMLIGQKIVRFVVSKNAQGYEIKRMDKDQYLFVNISDQHGAKSIELPLPMLGNILVKRI